MVGANGFEPSTSWSRTRRASQAALRPDSVSCLLSCACNHFCNRKIFGFRDQEVDGSNPFAPTIYPTPFKHLRPFPKRVRIRVSVHSVQLSTFRKKTASPQPLILDGSSKPNPLFCHFFAERFLGSQRLMGAIWMANISDGTFSKLRPSDGATLGVFPAGPIPIGLAFDGQNIWVANQGGANTVTKLRTCDGEARLSALR